MPEDHERTGAPDHPVAEDEPRSDGPAGAPGPTPPGAPGEAADAADGDERARLERERDEARVQAESYLDDLKRLKAEFENYKKRMLKEQTRFMERASVGLIERLLGVLDNFELALLAADRTKDHEAMVRGVEIVYSELFAALEKEGLERIDALDEPFDPELHEAVMRAEGEGDELYVVDEMRKGYTLHGDVLRPAMVKVGPKSKAEEEG